MLNRNRNIRKATARQLIIYLSCIIFLFALPVAAVAGQVTLTWNPPTTNTDGTPITYFNGDYKIYYGNSSGNYPQVTNLNNPNSIVTYKVQNLTDGQTYFFAVTAVDGLGIESPYSNEMSTVVKPETSATYSMTASASAHGGISPSGTVTVNSGASQTFNITPAAGYQVVSVTVDGTSVGAVATYTFNNITANHTISATFAYIAGEKQVCLSGCQYGTIQQAIDEADNGDAIKVAEGVYNENIIIELDKDIIIQGGWDNTFTSVNANPFLTVIDGDSTGDGIGDGSAVTITGGPGTTMTVDMENLTLTNGYAENGGGINIVSQANTVQLTLNNSVLAGNTAASGGGISAVSIGSGHALLSLVNNVIAENSATLGGAVRAYSAGAGSTTIMSITNDTITANTAVNGGGLHIESANGGNTSITARNEIIWGNKAASSGDDIFHNSDNPTTVLNTTYSNIGGVATNMAGYVAVASMINADPIFVNPAAGNYYLHADSPCKDMGTSVEAPDRDLWGDLRPQGAGYDLGAQEHAEAIASEIKLLSLNGGEVLPLGKPYNITWEAPTQAVSFTVKYSRNNGMTWNTLASDIKVKHYTWQVPSLKKNRNKCLVKVLGYAGKKKRIGSDRSDAPFSIQGVNLLSPAAAETTGIE